MKKLMTFAAAMTIVGGAYAQSEGPSCELDIPTGECASVYDVKMNLKTAVSWIGSISQVVGSECNLGTEKVPTCFRKPGKASINGYVVLCDCNPCGFLDEAEWVLWTSKWTGGEKKVYFDDVAAQTLLFNHIGKKTGDVELSMGVSFWGGEIALAGFGKWGTLKMKDQYKVNVKYPGLKSASGTLAGIIDPPCCVSKGFCGPSWAYSCGDFVDKSDTLSTVAFGTWSLKYNKSASQKYEKGTLVYPPAKYVPVFTCTTPAPDPEPEQPLPDNPIITG